MVQKYAARDMAQRPSISNIMTPADGPRNKGVRRIGEICTAFYLANETFYGILSMVHPVGADSCDRIRR